MVQMKAQSHAGITVRDLDASVCFYHDLLGLEISTRSAGRLALGLFRRSRRGYPLELVENAYERPGGHAEGIARYLENRPAPGQS
jgi:catechol 2,3-dioxygenase-like lactoylglutathione lyase family enzyme